jgi:tetratricopeptide (TPR) repeat protein
MLTEDYFMRMINQLLAVMTQILYHREAGRYQEAQVLIDQSLEQLLGVPPDLLRQMDDNSLLRLLTTQGELDPDRLALVADLYKLEGDLLSDQGKQREAELDYQRSMTFFLEIRLSGQDEGLYDIDQKIDNLHEKLSGRNLPIEVVFLVFDYFEMTNEYARVEEQISRLLEKDEQRLEILPEVIRYYESRLEQGDEELLAGGVARAEIEKRLQMVNNQFRENG